ncbi:MAG: hypothetical protein IPJ49_03650 [Candidatus Obscuribacter sp.]|nr:hypothetical protein [Candidatus Obscuribacter sp.]
MAKQIPEEDLKVIEEILKAHPNGVDLKFISAASGSSLLTARCNIDCAILQGKEEP